jgi:hypothetical protein
MNDETRASDALEARVLTSLRAEGLVRTSRWRRHLAHLAAAVAIFVAGAAAGQLAGVRSAPAPPDTAATPRYLLLLAGDVTPAADGSSRADEYGAWARSLAARRIPVRGDELSDRAITVSTRPAAAFPELSSVGGYFLIQAADDAEAEALARTSPHVKYGGSVVIRRVVVDSR